MKSKSTAWFNLAAVLVLVAAASSCSRCMREPAKPAPVCDPAPVAVAEEDEDEEEEEVDWVEKLAAEDDEPTAPAGLHLDFPVARISISGKSVSVGQWRSSAEVAPKREIEVLVVASWCTGCRGYLHSLSRSPKSERPDLIVFYQDEIESMLDNMESDGRISADDRSEMEQEFERDGQLLVSPQAVPPDLDYYFIESGEFRQYLDHFPTALKCGPESCEVIR